MHAFYKAAALAAAWLCIATAVPATAAVQSHPAATGFTAPGEESYNQYRQRYSREDRRRGYGRSDYRRDDRPTRVWRGRNGRYYCRKEDGTTGLLIGGAAGALLGRGLDGGRDRTIGTLLGGVAGALLGQEIERSNARCR